MGPLLNAFFFKHLCLSLCVDALFWLSHMEASCCHAILLGDAFSPTGAVARLELEESSLALKTLCFASGIEYKETLLLGENGIKALQSAIDSMLSDTEDLVFFLFLGHGYREASTRSPWPTLFFFHTGESFPMQMLLDRLNRIPKKFLCVLADCCNHKVKYKTVLSVAYAADMDSVKPRTLLNIAKGRFILAAAEAGSAAYCTRARHCCTAALWQALYEQFLQNEPNWEEIGPRVIQILSPLQIPYYILDMDSKNVG